MKQLFPYSKFIMAWVLVIPVLAWCYIGLFLTMFVWYPHGLEFSSWRDHSIHFSIVYIFWLVILFSYRLLDLEALRSTRAFFGRLLAALGLCLVVAALYFYFQPALLITPRRFLLLHMLISGTGILIWYILMRRAALHNGSWSVYAHSSFNNPEQIETLLNSNHVVGLKFLGVLSTESIIAPGSIVILPTQADIGPTDSRQLFTLRNQGIRFVEYNQLYEGLVGAVHLSALDDLWFINSIDYRTHHLFDAIKRVIDILLGAISALIFLASFPVIGCLIKLTSPGKIIFSQQRVGQNNKVFTLYKYRTMTTSSADNTWTAPADSRITKIGKVLRVLRLDELPQSLNILKGDMSIVGPRPEQVNIVKALEDEIPYYNERHAVKPGLTGWAQLHVYASSLEETRQKLQYDLYYIKHRSLFFDLEIIVKTFYNVITFSGR